MNRLCQFGCIAGALLMALTAAPAVSAHRFSGQRGGGPRQQERAARQRPMAQPRMQRQENRPGVRGAMGLPPKWVERLQQMSPEQQERFMRNNRKFQSLPPWRQEQIRRRLQELNQMPPQQREAMRKRLQIFQRLSPEERQEVVKDLAPRWKALPQNRKQVLTQRMRVLAGMTPQQRQQALQDPQFMRGLDPNEQDLLRKLTDLRLGPAPGQ
jgi:hypothetical protein